MKTLVLILSLFFVSPVFAAINFDGSDDNVLSANNIGLSGDLNATISAWVYVVGTKSLQSIVAFGGSNGNSVLSLFLNINGTDTGILSSEFNGGISVRTVAGTISKNQWYHVVVTKTPGGSDTTAKIYVNGTQQAVTGGSSTAPDITNSQVYIGKYTDSEHRFDGRIDDVRIYNRALSGSEIIEIYKAKKYHGGSFDRNSLVAYWPLDDFSPGVTASGVKTIRDYSENGNHGTPANSPVGATGNLKNATQIFSSTNY